MRPSQSQSQNKDSKTKKAKRISRDEEEESESEEEIYHPRPSQSRRLSQSKSINDDPNRFLGAKVRVDVYDKRKKITIAYNAVVDHFWEDKHSHVYYHIFYSDGDQEDLSLSELLDAIDYFKNQ